MTLSLTLTTSNLSNSVDLRKMLLPFTGELSPGLGLLDTEEGDAAGGGKLPRASKVTPDQRHPVYNAQEGSGFPTDGSAGPFQFTLEYPTRLNYYS